MASDPPENPNSSIASFEQALEALILSHFARGVPIEDTWEILTPVADSPDWAITIEKTSSPDSSPYQPRVIDEE